MKRAAKRGKEEPKEQSSSSSSESVELDLGEDGRIQAPGLIVRPFRSFPRALAEADAARLIPDAEAVFTARAIKKASKYSAGNTFWLAANDKPKCALEVLAREIFAFHATNAKFDPTKSGAEWWTQVLQPGDSIGLHWDKDYPLEDAGLSICPHIATVTYFSEAGGPTIVMHKDIPPLCAEPVAGPIQRAYLSRPRAGKHMSFDGYFLHGSDATYFRAPEDLSQFFAAPSSTTEFRVTFLVNVWLNHKPTNTVTLPATLRKKLSTAAAPTSFGKEAAPVQYTCFDSAAPHFKWTFAASENAPHTLTVPRPQKQVDADALELIFPIDNVAELVETKAEPKKKKKSK